MEAILEVVEATMILAIIAIDLQILDPWKEETLEAEVLAPMVVEAKTTKPRWLWWFQQQQ